MWGLYEMRKQTDAGYCLPPLNTKNKNLNLLDVFTSLELNYVDVFQVLFNMIFIFIFQYPPIP